MLPSGSLGALREDGDETAVLVDYREPDGLLWVQVKDAVADEAVPLSCNGGIVCTADDIRVQKTPAITGFSQVKAPKLRPFAISSPS